MGYGVATLPTWRFFVLVDEKGFAWGTVVSGQHANAFTCRLASKRFMVNCVLSFELVLQTGANLMMLVWFECGQLLEAPRGVASW